MMIPILSHAEQFGDTAKYNLALMDDIAIPMLSNIFGEKAKYFLYYSALGIYVILIVLGGIFKKKKKNKDKE